MTGVYANRMPRRIGGIVLAHALTDGGRIVAESTVTRLADDRFMLLSGAAAHQRDLDLLPLLGPRPRHVDYHRRHRLRAPPSSWPDRAHGTCSRR